MSPRPRFEKLDQEKREQILEAASEEFAARGFDSASINKIIDKAGISKGAAYYYFDDKNDLYLTAIEHALDRIKRWSAGDEELSPELLDADNYWDKWTEWATRGMRKMRETPWVTQLFKSFLSYFDTHRTEPAVELIWKATRGYTMRWIRRGQDVGVIRTDLPDDLFLEVFLGMSMSLDRWFFSAVETLTDEDIDELAVTLVDLFRRVSEPSKESS